MRNRTKLAVFAMCLTSLLAGIVIAEFVFVQNQTARIWADTTLEVTWLDTGQPATSYDWQDMNELTKDTPKLKIKMIGLAGGSVFWETVGLPTHFQETAFNYNSSLTWEVPYGLAYGQCMILKMTLRDMGQGVGNYAWAVNFYSTPG